VTNPLNELIAELNTLIRLTETESMIATARRVQARDDATERELAQNADEATERRDRLVEAVRDLDGMPNVVGAALGRIGAAARTQLLDQALPVQHALMADLMLEHQLRDRARFARVLAQAADESSIVALLEDLESAHAETIEWIETRLAEVALGGPAAIVATPVQNAARVGQNLVTMPTRVMVSGLNRAVDVLGGAQEAVAKRVNRNVQRVSDIGEAAEQSATAARDAFLETSEDQAERKGARRTARAVRRTRTEVGALNADELPIKKYDDLVQPEAINQIDKLDDVDDIRAVIAYENANKGRRRVVEAAEKRIEAIAEEMARN
jgi:bacterioferritin (cytochrome b1)